MSLIARSPLLRQPSVLRTRLSAPVRFSHGDYHHFPFAFPGEKKKGLFGLKLAIYLGTGFSIPFLASWYQLKKAAGA